MTNFSLYSHNTVELAQMYIDDIDNILIIQNGKLAELHICIIYYITICKR